MCNVSCEKLSSGADLSEFGLFWLGPFKLFSKCSQLLLKLLHARRLLSGLGRSLLGFPHLLPLSSPRPGGRCRGLHAEDIVGSSLLLGFTGVNHTSLHTA